MSQYLVHGHLAKPAGLSPAPETFMAPEQPIAPRMAGPFSKLMSAVWISGDEHKPSACAFFVTTTKDDVEADVTLSPDDYGFKNGQMVNVVQKHSDGSEKFIDKVS